MKNSQKGFAPIILIIILVVLAGGGYALVKTQKAKVESQKEEVKVEQSLTPNVVIPETTSTAKVENQAVADKTDKTKDWKTYRNEKYGFELKYPPELKVSEKNGDTWLNVSFDKPNSNLRIVFFVGMREVGGPGEGSIPVWAKKIMIDGRQIEETLSSTGEKGVLLQINNTSDKDNRYDNFSSVFISTQENAFVPEIESIAKTLKYIQ